VSIAYIGIGSNLGDRQKNIETAIQKLRERKGIEVKEISSVIETEPVGDTEQPKFFNACFRVETGLYPDELLDVLQSIEREMGRDRSTSSRLNTEEQLKMLQEGKLDLDTVNTLIASKNQQEQKQQKRWGPRTIDLDILFYDDIIMKGNNLIIPHPLLHERVFVLQPLSEIAPNLMHPIFKKSINEMLMEYRVRYESS
jgi:2-amino-4-hydroxy-6-hydroxymethyldihydropteridine diphosphokinase